MSKQVYDVKKGFDKIRQFCLLDLELLPNYLRILYIANCYISNPNIPLTSGMDPNLDVEHIRNAFAHHHYIILPGVDMVLLWDPPLFGGSYWEKSYNIEELYKNATNCLGYTGTI